MALLSHYFTRPIDKVDFRVKLVDSFCKDKSISAKEIPKFFFVAQRKRKLLLRMLVKFNQEGDEHLALFEQNIIKKAREEAYLSML